MATDAEIAVGPSSFDDRVSALTVRILARQLAIARGIENPDDGDVFWILNDAIRQAKEFIRKEGG